MTVHGLIYYKEELLSSDFLHIFQPLHQYAKNKSVFCLTGLSVGAGGVCSPLVACQVDERKLAVELVCLITLLLYSIQVSQNYLKRSSENKINGEVP